MLNIIGQRRWFFLISALVILFGLISLGIFGLKPGIDFTGGSRLTVEFVTKVERSELQKELALLGHEEAVLQVNAIKRRARPERVEQTVSSFLIFGIDAKRIQKEALSCTRITPLKRQRTAGGMGPGVLRVSGQQTSNLKFALFEFALESKRVPQCVARSLILRI